MLLSQISLRERWVKQQQLRREQAARIAASRSVPRYRTDKSGKAADMEGVRAELKAVDRHAAELDQLLARLGSDGSFLSQELRTERSRLDLLKSELQHDLGHPLNLDDRQRAIRRMRTKDLADSYWRQADQAASAGDHRHARNCRHYALMARRIAEFDMGLRRSLRGFTVSG